MNSNKIVWLVVGIIIIGTLSIVGIVILFVLPSRPARTFQYGTVVEPPKPFIDFTLTTEGGAAHSLSEYRGKVVLLYFGYTSCPDICPTTLSNLKQAMQQLGSSAQNVQVIMVTVDPDRDSPEKIAHYVHAFNPQFLGLSGTPDQIAAVAQADGIFYAKDPPDGNGNYTMSHFAGVMGIDRVGDVRLIFPYGITGDQFAQDVSQLLKQ